MIKIFHQTNNNYFMKRILNLFLFVLCFSSINAAVENKTMLVSDFDNEPSVQALSPEMAQLAIDKFLALTPKTYKEMTGKKLGFKKALQLKAAQKIVKKRTKNSDDIPKGVYIILAILGWAWLLMGIMDDWEGNNWWVNLLLYLLCWLPGLIHALTKMDEYY